MYPKRKLKSIRKLEASLESGPEVQGLTFGWSIYQLSEYELKIVGLQRLIEKPKSKILDLLMNKGLEDQLGELYDLADTDDHRPA